MNFGHGVAEQEEALRNYFVETQIFDEFVAGSHDLVLGHKGSGKTAIFRMLVDNNYVVSQLESVDIVPAVDLYGNVQFRKVNAEADPSSIMLYDAWCTYIAAVVGNHLADTYDHDLIGTLRESLEVTGLREPRRPDKQGFFARFFDPDPVVIKSARPFIVDPDAVQTILQEAREALRALGRECWVVFDRLDEAFTESAHLEVLALRELLQVMRDFNYPESAVKIKAFLRNDVFERVGASKKTRLVNMTHISKTLIAWPSDVLVDLICRRLAGCQAFLDEYELTPEHATHGRSRAEMMRALLPQSPPTQRYWPPIPQAGGEMPETAAWIMSGTAFGGAQYSPRNVLSFLELARRRMRAWQRLNPDSVGPSLLSPPVLGYAAKAVSELRRDDTLLVEFPAVAEWIPKLRGGPAEYEARLGLANRLGLTRDEGQFNATLDLLLNSGLMESLANDALGIARLYRPALEAEAFDGTM